MNPTNFIHLRVHSAYSLLEGAITVSAMVEAAVQDKQPALGIVDTGNLFGALEFAEKARENGIQPIIGCSFEIQFPEEMQLKQESTLQTPLEYASEAIVLIAATEEGWRNLSALVSSTCVTREDSGYRCPVTISQLVERRGGIIALTGGGEGPIDRCMKKSPSLAKRRLEQLYTIYGSRLYVELQRHIHNKTCNTNDLESQIVALAYELGVPLVATNEPFFLTKEDYEAHDVLSAIATGNTVYAENRRRLTPSHYFKSRAEMTLLFEDLPEAIDNTVEIAKRCSYFPKPRKSILPKFDITSDEKDLLRNKAIAGLAQRLNNHGLAPGFVYDDYTARLDFELSVIMRMEYAGYFLIVSDFIGWAKSQGIPVGPGRGSGAGSLVAWAMAITDIDPLRFGLLFERFLNPDRVSMPDFDVDFCQDRRDEVIAYVCKRYGQDRVAQIITFGTLQARAVVRDVGRALQMPYGQVDKIAKMIPNNPGVVISLKQVMLEEQQIKSAMNEEPIVAKLFRIACRLEGLYRHASIHAAGVVIGDRPLVELLPTYHDPESNMLVTQYNMKWSESAGLIKFDFLGLKTLTLLKKAVDMVARRGIDVDILALPFDDFKTFSLLNEGKTLGVFQVESPGMRRALIDIVPDRFEDLIALVSLYRPGPMANIAIYVSRKHGREIIEYPHPVLERVLQETYGIIVYQEQVMEISKILAGYSLGEADILRRAMGKKNKAEMDSQRERFVAGALGQGVSEHMANEIFDLLAKFAGYGFNKSHAAGYAVILYQTAYMKAHFPAEFIAASMTSEITNTDKLNALRQEAMRLKVVIEPPSINSSRVIFDVKDGRIIYALMAIKGVGEQAAEHIVNIRGDVPFADITDFANRIDPGHLNRRTMESMISAGAFDCLESNRARVMAAIDCIFATANRRKADEVVGQGALFGFSENSSTMEVALPNVNCWLKSEQLQRECESLGFYLSLHPLDDYLHLTKHLHIKLWDQFVDAIGEGAVFGRLFGVVLSRQKRRTKNGYQMGIVQLSDPSGQYEVVMFSDSLDKYWDVLEIGRAAMLHVRAEARGSDDTTVRLESAEELDISFSKYVKDILIFFTSQESIAELHRYLMSLIQRSGSGIMIVAETNGRAVKIQLPGRWQVSPQFAEYIERIPGVRAIEFLYNESY